MKTIPLKPIFENEQFNTLSSSHQLFFLKAVYLLAEHGLLYKLPKVLRGYFHCCNPSYYTFKHVYESILDDVIPKMMQIKGNYKKQTANGSKAIYKNAIERKSKRDKSITFSDSNEHMQIIPVPFSPEKSRFHQGMTDHVARNKAIESNKDGKEGWLVDS